MASSEEYNTLREELLKLVERAYGAWRSGMIEIAAVGAAVLSQKQLVQSVVCTEYGKFILYGVLLSVAYWIARLESWQALSFERGADRIGGFLAVFYDDSGIQDQSTKDIGWQAWNRVRKAAEKDVKKRIKNETNQTALSDPPPRVIYVGHRCESFTMVLVLFGGLLFILLFVETWNLFNLWMWLSLGVGILEVGCFHTWVKQQSEEAKRDAVDQTIMWYQIKRLPLNEVQRYLKYWGRPEAPNETQPAGSY